MRVLWRTLVRIRLQAHRPYCKVSVMAGCWSRGWDSRTASIVTYMEFRPNSIGEDLEIPGQRDKTKDILCGSVVQAVSPLHGNKHRPPKGVALR